MSKFLTLTVSESNASTRPVIECYNYSQLLASLRCIDISIRLFLFAMFRSLMVPVDVQQH